MALARILWHVCGRSPGGLLADKSIFLPPSSPGQEWRWHRYKCLPLRFRPPARRRQSGGEKGEEEEEEEGWRRLRWVPIIAVVELLACSSIPANMPKRSPFCDAQKSPLPSPKNMGAQKRRIGERGSLLPFAFKANKSCMRGAFFGPSQCPAK